MLGDIYMLIGATGYGLSNSLEEYFVRRRPLYEVRCSPQALQLSLTIS